MAYEHHTHTRRDIFIAVVDLVVLRANPHQRAVAAAGAKLKD